VEHAQSMPSACPSSFMRDEVACFTLYSAACCCCSATHDGAAEGLPMHGGWVTDALHGTLQTSHEIQTSTYIFVSHVSRNSDKDTQPEQLGCGWRVSKGTNHMQ
jgi:hypothetical protein